jgi:hypothetical protein
MFRPEDKWYEAKHITNAKKEGGFMYNYNWDALQDWIHSCQQDTSILSKFRLQSVFHRVHGLTTDFATKVILTHYRGRNRTMWTQEQRHRYQAEHDRLRRQAALHDGTTMDDHQYEELHKILSRESNKQMAVQLKDNTLQLKAFNSACTNIDQNFANAADGTSSTDNHVMMASLSHVNISDAARKAEALYGDKEVNDDDVNDEDEENNDDTYDSNNDDNNNSTSPASKRKTEIDGLAKGLNKLQQDIFDVYRAYFESGGESDLPPDVVLLHGAAGTGKSHVIKCVDGTATICNVPVLRTSFNAITAKAIGADTFSSIAHLQAIDINEIRAIPPDQLQRFISETNIKLVKLIIVDEISTFAPWHLARLDALCRAATGKDNLPFGGIPVILCGDLSQLGPVKAGKSFTQSLLAIATHKAAIGELTMASIPTNQAPLLGTATGDAAEVQEAAPSPNPRPRKRTKKSEKAIADAKKKQDHLTMGSPFRVGSELFSKATFHELLEQIRADGDEEHIKIVEKGYRGEPITGNDMQQYSTLSNLDFLAADSPWIKAPIIVATNRERHTLNHPMCIRIAKATGRAVIRWPTSYKNWEQKPSTVYLEHAMKDPCFYEYFVEGLEGFMTANYNKKWGMVNGSKIEYHSIVPCSDAQKEQIRLGLLDASPGDVITLTDAPAIINVVLVDEERDKEGELNQVSIEKWKDVTLQEGRVIVPILPKGIKRADKAKTIVPGGRMYLPSKIVINAVFSLEPATAITVHKSQGRTLGKVILALSQKNGMQCNMTYASIYVALSRVKKKSDIRLLLTGRRGVERLTLCYLRTLKPDTSIQAYFEGYKANAAQWNEFAAYKKYEKLTQPKNK